MQLPAHLIINRKKWTIEIVPASELYHGDSKCLGICDADTKTIEISDKLSGKELIKTALHEVLHAAEFSYDFRIAHKTIYLLEKPLGDLFFALLNSFFEGRTAGSSKRGQRRPA